MISIILSKNLKDGRLTGYRNRPFDTETAIHEILNRLDIPLSVSINEAIELAKKYSTEESGAFINGVLGKIAEHAPVTKREKRHS